MILILLTGCDTQNEIRPELIDERQEMLNVMGFTAQIVGHAVASQDVRAEILGHAFPENGGEVEASFSELLSSSPRQRSLINNAESGNFAERFRLKAQGFRSDNFQKFS
ncbi:MAG: hypothetical protein ACJAXX_000138 [Roseivirga sp.]|jgi:hypothetical protein